jgi:hypothetical protein
VLSSVQERVTTPSSFLMLNVFSFAPFDSTVIS